jgi:hypothetical protein
VKWAGATSSHLAYRRRPAQQLRQLGEVDRHPPGLVLGEQISRRASARLFLEIEIAERLSVGVLHDEARIVMLLDHPRRRETAGLEVAGCQRGLWL